MRRFWKVYKFPIVFVIILVVVQLITTFTKHSFSSYGVYPLKLEGFFGVFTFPLIHSDWYHLVSNASSLILLLGILFYVFRSVAYLIFVISYILPGIITWFIGRESFHIGASGMVYALIGFILMIGIFKKQRNVMALSAFVLFYHAGFFWGMLPQGNHVSWETHVGGFIVGVLVAYFLKDFTFSSYKYLPNKNSLEYSNVTATEDFRYVYLIKKPSSKNKLGSAFKILY